MVYKVVRQYFISQIEDSSGLSEPTMHNNDRDKSEFGASSGPEAPATHRGLVGRVSSFSVCDRKLRFHMAYSIYLTRTHLSLYATSSRYQTASSGAADSGGQRVLLVQFRLPHLGLSDSPAVLAIQSIQEGAVARNRSLVHQTIGAL